MAFSEAPDYESELAQSQQQARLEQAQMQAQDQAGRQQQVKGLAGQARQQATQAAKQQAVEAVKKQIKKKILLWVLTSLAALLVNPVTWVFLATGFLIILGAWCWDNKASCTELLGTNAFNVFWNVIKLWF